MTKIAAQLAELAQQPCWDEVTQQPELAMLDMQLEAAEAFGKEEIICFVFIPDTEEPENPEPVIPEPEKPIPDEKDSDDELVSIAG